MWGDRMRGPRPENDGNSMAFDLRIEFHTFASSFRAQTMSSTRWKVSLAGASLLTLGESSCGCIGTEADPPDFGAVYFHYAHSPVRPTAKTSREPTVAEARRLKGEVYSGHNCVAGMVSGPGQDSTRCIFKNVCLTLDQLIPPGSGVEVDHPKGFVQPSSVRMKYFRPRIARGAPLFWYDEFSLKSSWVRIDRDSALTPELVYEPLPNNEELTWWSPAPVSTSFPSHSHSQMLTRCCD